MVTFPSRSSLRYACIETAGAGRTHRRSFAVEEIVTALSEQHAELAGILEGLDEADWQRLTPSCEGWTVLDVVLHLAQTDEVAIESAQGLFGSEFASMFTDGASTANVDEAAEVMVVAQ